MKLVAFPSILSRPRASGIELMLLTHFFPIMCFNNWRRCKDFFGTSQCRDFHSPLHIFEERYTVQKGDKYRASGGNRGGRVGHVHTGLGMQGLGDRGCGIIWTPGSAGEHRERVGRGRDWEPQGVHWQPES